jgi:hypothetical protein
MKAFLLALAPLLLSMASHPVSGANAEVVACVVADTPENPAYYGMATTVTQLKCEFTNKDYLPTLGQLYKQGWRLIEVVGGDHALSMGNRGPSPLYFLEREVVPVAPEQRQGAKKK